MHLGRNRGWVPLTQSDQQESCQRICVLIVRITSKTKKKLGTKFQCYAGKNLARKQQTHFRSSRRFSPREISDDRKYVCRSQASKITLGRNLFDIFFTTLH